MRQGHLGPWEILEPRSKVSRFACPCLSGISQSSSYGCLFMLCIMCLSCLTKLSFQKHSGVERGKARASVASSALSVGSQTCSLVTTRGGAIHTILFEQLDLVTTEREPRHTLPVHRST